jgi:hypothetical protein
VSAHDTELEPDDAKLITLARATRARNSAAEGAAVRDEMGRTYTASTVTLPSLSLSALQAAVAIAVASGSRGLEAAALVTEGAGPTEADVAAVRDLGGPRVSLLLADPSGELRSPRTPPR